MASSVRGREQDSRDREGASRDAEDGDKRQGQRNTPRLFQTLFDHKRRTNDERNRGGTRKLKSDTFKEVPGCSQVYVTQNPAQVFLRTDSHTDCPKSVKFSCHECHDLFPLC